MNRLLTPMPEHKVRVSSKGQIVIPKEIRKKYKMSSGTELILKPLDKRRLMVERIPKLSEFFGNLGTAKATELLERERELEVKAELERDEELGSANSQRKKIKRNRRK